MKDLAIIGTSGMARKARQIVDHLNADGAQTGTSSASLMIALSSQVR